MEESNNGKIKSFKDKVHFYYISLGSLTEVQNQLLLARDLGFIDKPEFQKLADQTVTANKLINGMIKKCKTFIK